MQAGLQGLLQAQAQAGTGVGRHRRGQAQAQAQAQEHWCAAWAQVSGSGMQAAQ